MDKTIDITSVPDKVWWKEAVVYQVYPLSFKDSNGDGKGDLVGIASKLDYLKSLGVDVLWLNPIFKSPNDDNGYDISDYEDIMSDFGTMSDFDNLLHEAHNRGLKIILDLVVNHTSDEHPWFRASKSSRNNPYRDYYHWWPAEKGIPPQRISDFDENRSAWKYDEKTDSYFLHYFSARQPDLNWENPKMREEFYQMMLFWCDKGIDGFRIDAVPYISKDHTFPKVDWSKYDSQFDYYYQSSIHLHEYLHEMYHKVFSKYDIMTVGEGSTFLNFLDFTDPDRQELDMIYAGYGPQMPSDGGKAGVSFDLCKFKQFNAGLYDQYGEKGWPCVILGNHDLPRIVSIYGSDQDPYRAVSAKMLITYLFSMRGTPYWYMGDEIGMTNIYFDSIDDYNDIGAKSGYKYALTTGGETAARKFLEIQGRTGRDNSRTPFQWDISSNAGFSTSKPWLKINDNYLKGVNVHDEEKDDNSILQYFKKAIRLRKEYLGLIYGSYKIVEEENPQLYIYLRETTEERFLVVINFSSKDVAYNATEDLSTATILLHNYETKVCYENQRLSLYPYEAIIFKLK